MSTSEAIGTIIRCHVIIVVNAVRAINAAAHAQPWAFIVGFALLTTVTSSVAIGNARAERDNANYHMAAMQDTIENYRILVESREYAQYK